MKALNNSVHKTFNILEKFTIQKPAWGVTELANEIGTNKSTIYRFLADLNNLGILSKEPETEKYRLGLKLFELGNRVQLKKAFIEKTHPELENVAKNIKETVHLALLKNQKVFYVDKVERPQGLKNSSETGTSSPIHATALGKILLANLEAGKRQALLQNLFSTKNLHAYTKNTITKKTKLINELNTIKKNGYAIDQEEFEIGLICVAIPIYNLDGNTVASLSASGPANRFKKSEISKYVRILKKGADAIKHKIGYFNIVNY